MDWLLSFDLCCVPPTLPFAQCLNHKMPIKLANWGYWRSKYLLLCMTYTTAAAVATTVDVGFLPLSDKYFPLINFMIYICLMYQHRSWRTEIKKKSSEIFVYVFIFHHKNRTFCWVDLYCFKQTHVSESWFVLWCIVGPLHSIHTNTPTDK